MSRTTQALETVGAGSITGIVLFGIYGLTLTGGNLISSGESGTNAWLALLVSFAVGLVAGAIASIAVGIAQCKVGTSFFVGAIAVGVAWVIALVIIGTTDLIPPGPGSIPPATLMIAIFTWPIIPIGGLAGLAACKFLESTNQPKGSTEDGL